MRRPGAKEGRGRAGTGKGSPAALCYKSPPSSPTASPKGGPGPQEPTIALALLNTNLPPVAIVLIIAILVISLGIHEAAHGWMALQCGDTTARDLGRITLNPVAHIDPMMTIIIPVFLFLSTGFIFGGAKPVPVNFYQLRRPHRDMALVAFAGPLSNFLIAAVLLLAQRLMVDVFGVWDGRESLGSIILGYGVFLNLLLAAFNLMPVPPLDGSRIMTWILPGGLREAYAGLERFGLLLIFGLIFFVPWFRVVLGELIYALSDLLDWIVSVGGLW
jgi:Zn-dependent protease